MEYPIDFTKFKVELLSDDLFEHRYGFTDGRQIIASCVIPTYGKRGMLIGNFESYIRNEGVGTHFLMGVIDYIKTIYKQSTDKIYIKVEKKNKIARHLYKKCGFVFESCKYDIIKMKYSL